MFEKLKKVFEVKDNPHHFESPCEKTDCKAFKKWRVDEHWPQAWLHTPEGNTKFWMHSFSHCVVCKHFRRFDMYIPVAKKE